MPGRLLRRLALAGALAAAGPLPAAQTVPLTPAQQRWLADHPTIRFAPERDYGPFVYQRSDGQVDGLSVDMLHLLQARTGFAAQMLPARALKQQLEAARRREADLLSSLRPTPERAAYLAFTRPYVSVPALLVARGSGEPAAGGNPLASYAGRKVAVGAGYAVEAVVRASHPQVLWQAVSDDVVALQGVAEGRFDAAVADAASLAFVQREHGLAGLQAAGRVGFDYTLSFAVRGDWPQLRDILDAGIQQISAEERQKVLDKWMPQALPAPHPAPMATRVGAALLLLALCVGAGLAWRHRRQRRP